MSNEMSGRGERFTRFSLRNLPGIGLLSLLWLILSIWAYSHLPVSLLPNLNFPTISIVVENPGLTSVELEKQVAIPVESAMSGVYRVSRIRSATVANLSLITVQFEWGADLELARQQVMQKLATVQPLLPQGSNVQTETLQNTLGQVQSWIITGGASLFDLHELALYKLKPLLLQQSGVFEVQVFGGLAPEYAVFLRPERLEEFDLALKDVRDTLAKNNIASPGGLLDLGSQSFAILPQSRMTGVEDIERTVIAVKNNVPIRVRDIGRVAKTHLPYRGGAEREGKSGVILTIVKQPDSDTVAVARGIDRFFKEHPDLIPRGAVLSKYYDQSEMVVESIRGVEEAVVLGAALVGVILLVFLRSWRAALVAFISIPTSLLSALLFMQWLGMSLNIMTLGALAVATGIVIDDAIVVIENFFRHRTLTPEDPIADVFVRATSEVMWPIASSTIATVAIFAPFTFLSGIAGKLFAPVGIVVSIVMMASLLFSLTLIPSVGTRLLARARPEKAWKALPDLYQSLLDRCLHWRKSVLTGAFVVSAASLLLFLQLNREFLPLLDEGAILMTMDAPPSSSLEETIRVQRLLIGEVFHDPDFETVVAANGHAPGMQDTDTMNHGDITAKLVPRGKRKRSLEDLMDLFRKRMEAFPGVSANFTLPFQDKINDAVGGISASVGVKVFGDDLKVLEELGDELMGRMAEIPGVVDLRSSVFVPAPSVEVAIIPEKAEPLGIGRDDLSSAVQAMAFGAEATRIRELYREVPLMLRIEGTQDEIPTLHLEEMKRLPIRTTDGPFVPLSQVADFRISETPSRIEHEHASRLVTISCNVSGVKNQEVVDGIRRAIAQLKLPPGYVFEIAGNLQAQNEATQGVAAIAIVSLLLVAALLWIEFASLRKMLLILCTIPFSTVGAGALLFVTHQTLNVSSLIGLVMLMGIVLRNGIVLVDYVHLAHQRGLPLDQAIEQGARIRLRPILMTALSEILGLLPLALGLGAGYELARPLALTVIGGLATSTFLTLIVLPLGYRMIYSRRV